MLELNPWTSIQEVDNTKSSLEEWQRQALELHEELNHENDRVQAKIKSLFEQFRRLA